MKIYTYNGETFTSIPNPLKLADGSTISPVSEETFIANGGTITDGGEPTPEQRVWCEFSELIEDLSEQTDKITPEEFLRAAQNGISSDLVAFARERGVPEEVIGEGRTRIVEIMADALRVGMTWAELISGVIPQA